MTTSLARRLACAALLSPIVIGWSMQTPTAAPAVSAPVLKWQRGGCRSTWCRTGWYASPAVADLDGDGKAEVVWADYRIVVVQGEDGNDEWVVNSPGGGRTWPDPVVADINGDGALEVVVAHSGGYVSVTRADGTSLAGWPQQPAPGNELRSLAVGDVDGDGDFEIAVASTGSDNQWFLLEHSGATRAGWPKQIDSDATGYAAGCFNENVGLADIDGDGSLELVGPNDTHYVSAFRHDGTPIRAHSKFGQVDGLNKVWARVGFHYSEAVDLRGTRTARPARCRSSPVPTSPTARRPSPTWTAMAPPRSSSSATSTTAEPIRTPACSTRRTSCGRIVPDGRAQASTGPTCRFRTRPQARDPRTTTSSRRPNPTRWWSTSMGTA